MDPNEIFNVKTLIFVPHYDDEIIGLGGIITQVKNKNLFNFHFMTDGSSSPSPPYGQTPGEQEILRNTRKNESTEALRFIGVNTENLSFSGLPENKGDRIVLAEGVKKLIKSLEPSIILIPFRFDRHRDHTCLSRTVIDVVRKSSIKVKVYEYFIYHRWKLLPKGDIRKYIFPNMLLEFDVSKISSIKKESLNFFKSQTTLFFPWQTRPILTEEFISNNAKENEVLLESNLELKDMDFFMNSKIRILLVHTFEYRLKKIKEDILFFIKIAFRFFK